MFCQQCGQAVPERAVFCPRCGASVTPVAGFARRMVRPRAYRRAAGVCAAFARHYGWDLTATRILVVVLGVFLFPVMEVAYLFGWMLIPDEPLSVPIL